MWSVFQLAHFTSRKEQLGILCGVGFVSLKLIFENFRQCADINYILFLCCDKFRKKALRYARNRNVQYIYSSNYKKISDFRPVSLWMKTRKATSSVQEKLNKLNLLL